MVVDDKVTLNWEMCDVVRIDSVAREEIKVSRDGR